MNKINNIISLLILMFSLNSCGTDQDLIGDLNGITAEVTSAFSTEASIQVTVPASASNLIGGVSIYDKGILIVSADINKGSYSKDNVSVTTENGNHMIKFTLRDLQPETSYHFNIVPQLGSDNPSILYPNDNSSTESGLNLVSAQIPVEFQTISILEDPNIEILGEEEQPFNLILNVKFISDSSILIHVYSNAIQDYFDELIYSDSSDFKNALSMDIDEYNYFKCMPTNLKSDTEYFFKVKGKFTVNIRSAYDGSLHEEQITATISPTNKYTAKTAEKGAVPIVSNGCELSQANYEYNYADFRLETFYYADNCSSYYLKCWTEDDSSNIITTLADNKTSHNGWPWIKFPLTNLQSNVRYYYYIEGPFLYDTGKNNKYIPLPSNTRIYPKVSYFSFSD